MQSADASVAAGSRPFFGWWVVVVSAIGMATGVASVNLFAFGVFQKPLMQEFGWTATEISGVLAIATVLTVITSPFIGMVVDRLGARRVAMASMVLLFALFGSLYWLTASLWHFYLVFGLMPILAAGTSSVAYARIVSRWFDRRRGLALGLTLAGVGLGGVFVPAYANWLIETQGWRVAYVGLGAVSVLVTLPLAFFFLRESPESMGLRPDGAPAVDADGRAAPATTLVGYEAKQALRQPTMWLMIAAFAVLGLAIGGTMIPLVPILEDRGIDRATALGMAAFLGIGLVLGRIVAGVLMDRFHAPYVAVAFLLGPIVGLTMLAGGATGFEAMTATFLLGLAAGAEVDVIAYMVGRYFGTRAYATLYGVLYAAWTFGSGFGPAVSALALDRTGSYAPALTLYVGVMLVACLLLLRLGPYPKLPD